MSEIRLLTLLECIDMRTNVVDHFKANILVTTVEKAGRMMQAILEASLVDVFFIDAFLLLQLLHVSNRHFNNFCLFDAATSFALKLWRN